MEKFAATGNAILATMELQELHRFYQANCLPADADRALQGAIRRGGGIRDCMSTFTTSVEIDWATRESLRAGVLSMLRVRAPLHSV